MKVLVLGATGGTGVRLVERALAAGHEVTAFARTPANVRAQHERLRVAQGDATREDDVARAVEGQDAVVSAIGPRPGTPPGTLISDATRNALRAMERHGATRFVFESGIMVGDGRALSLPMRGALALFRAINRALYEDKVRAEDLVRDSAIEWVIVRPPSLKELPPRGRYEAGENLRVALTKTMAHADVADALVRALAEPAWTRRVIDLSY